MTLAFFLMAAAVAAASVPLLRRSSLAESSLDRPNHRSLHQQPTPRIGGIAIAVATATTIGILTPQYLSDVPLMLAACLALVSAFDDRRHMSVALRLTCQLTAALFMAAVWMGDAATGDVMTNWTFTPWTTVPIVLAICWATNLFNFMDGADGMAGGMACIGFGTYAIAAASKLAPELEIACVAATVSGAALGFLFFNMPVARIFMGDAGSIPIGFLAAVFGIHGTLTEVWPWWFGILVFSPFIVDASITLMRRLVRREKIWQAHRQHYYQRLILSGWSHGKTVGSYYLLMLGSAISALVAQNGEYLYPMVTFWVITYSALLLYLEWRFHQPKKDKIE